MDTATEGQPGNQINVTNTDNKGSGWPGYFHSSYCMPGKHSFDLAIFQIMKLRINKMSLQDVKSEDYRSVLVY